MKIQISNHIMFKNYLIILFPLSATTIKEITILPIIIILSKQICYQTNMLPIQTALADGKRLGDRS